VRSCAAVTAIRREVATETNRYKTVAIDLENNGNINQNYETRV